MDKSTINWSGRILSPKQIVIGERYVLAQVDEKFGTVKLREVRIANLRNDLLSYSTEKSADHKPIPLLELGIAIDIKMGYFDNLKMVQCTMSALFVNMKQAMAYARRLEKGIFTPNEIGQLKAINPLALYPKVKFAKGSIYSEQTDIRYSMA